MEQPASLADSFMTDLLAEKRWPLKVRLQEIECEFHRNTHYMRADEFP